VVDWWRYSQSINHDHGKSGFGVSVTWVGGV
jgi:hypothetical protein